MKWTLPINGSFSQLDGSTDSKRALQLDDGDSVDTSLLNDGHYNVEGGKKSTT